MHASFCPIKYSNLKNTERSSPFSISSKVIEDQPGPIPKTVFDIWSFCYTLGHLIDILRYPFCTLSLAAQFCVWGNFSSKEVSDQITKFTAVCLKTVGGSSHPHRQIYCTSQFDLHSVFFSLKKRLKILIFVRMGHGGNLSYFFFNLYKYRISSKGETRGGWR